MPLTRSDGRRTPNEVAALRREVDRVMASPTDVERQAIELSRLCLRIVAAARAQRAISAEVAHGLTDALRTILQELDAPEAPRVTR